MEVNLMVPLFDRLGARLEKLGASSFNRAPEGLSRWGWFGTYALLIVLILPNLKIITTRPITLVPKAKFALSKEMDVIAKNYFYCRTVYPEAYKPYALWYELAHLNEIRQVYHRGLAEQLMLSGAKAGN